MTLVGRIAQLEARLPARGALTEQQVQSVQEYFRNLGHNGAHEEASVAHDPAVASAISTVWQVILDPVAVFGRRIHDPPEQGQSFGWHESWLEMLKSASHA